MTTTFFTADTHFLHAGILAHCPNRPGRDVEEMTALLIERWNAWVGPRDQVWHLGDFAFGRTGRWQEIFDRLHGRKHLIVGNHDKSKKILTLGWESVDLMKTWKQDGYSAVLCHYPLLTWDRAHHGRWHLHGHAHGNLDPTTANPTRMDVGIDTHPQCRPYALEEIVAQLAGQTYRPVDHHQDRP